MNTMNEEVRMKSEEEDMESKQRKSYKQRTEDYVRKLYQK